MTQARYCPVKNSPCDRLCELSAFPSKVFISFDSKIDNMFLEKIRSIIKDMALEPVDYNEEKITVQFYCEFICKKIQDSLFVVADLTYWPYEKYHDAKSYVKYAANPNVAMEIGLAYAFEKPIILLIDRNHKNMSNFEGTNICYYNFMSANLEEFYQEFREIVENTIRGVLSRKKVEFIYDFEKVLKNVVIPFENLCSEERLLIRNNFDVITKFLSKDEKFYEYKKKSIEIFEEKMKNNVRYRDIVSSAFLSKHDKKYIKRVIELLNTHSNYEIAITPYEIPFILEIIDNKVAWLQYWSEYYTVKDVPVMQCVVFTLRGTVEELKNQFYSLWDDESTIKDKREIMKKLEEL